MFSQHFINFANRFISGILERTQSNQKQKLIRQRKWMQACKFKINENSFHKMFFFQAFMSVQLTINTASTEGVLKLIYLLHLIDVQLIQLCAANLKFFKIINYFSSVFTKTFLNTKNVLALKFLIQNIAFMKCNTFEKC